MLNIAPERFSVNITGSSALVGGRGSLTDVWSAVVSESPPDFTPFCRDKLVSLSGLSLADARVCARHQLLALAAVRKAWEEARLPQAFNELRGRSARHRQHRWGLVVASSVANLMAMEADCEESRDRLSPFSLTRWRGNSIATVISIVFGLGGGDWSVNTASASGAQAVALGGHMVKTGGLDLVVVVGADLSPSGVIRKAMESTGSIDANLEGRPLSAARFGMQPTGGAACVILESTEHARARGCSSQVEWVAGRCANEVFGIVAPEPSGATLSALVEELRSELALSCGSDRIDWVSLHATGTQKYDAAEIRGLRKLLQEQRPWLSSFKRSTGHTLGAAGVVDAALVAHGLSIKVLPEWPEGTDPALELPALKPSIVPAPRRALVCAQGMGGAVVVNCLQRHPDGGND